MVPTSSSSPALAPDLEQYDRYYLRGPGGTIRFNSAGVARLAPWFADHGFTLTACRTEAQFKETLRQVLAVDIDRAQSELHGLLESEDCSDEERAALARLLERSPHLGEA